MGIAFDVADKYRTPTMLLADGIIGQMMEPVELPEMKEYKPTKAEKPWAAMGWKPEDGEDKRAVINSLYIGIDEMHEVNMRLMERYARIKENETKSSVLCTSTVSVLI